MTADVSTRRAHGRPTAAGTRLRRLGSSMPTRTGLAVIVLLVLVLYLFPLLFLINTALKSPAAFNQDPVGLVTAPQLGNFAAAWVRGNFGAYLFNSVLYTGSATAIGTAVGLLMAFPVSRGYIAGSRGWTLLFTLVLFLPNAILTQFQLLLRLHLYDTQLGYILIMSAGVGVGPLLLRGFIAAIPRELDESAAIDGIGYWRYLFTFVVSLTRPAIATVAILQAIWVWNEIVLATILLPDQSKSPITLGLLNFEGTYSNQWPLLAAATLIVAAPLVLAYLFLQRFLVSGVLGGAVKG